MSRRSASPFRTQSFNRPDRRTVLVWGAGSCLAACSGVSRPDERTLVIGRPGDVSTLDPAVVMNVSDYAPLCLAYQRLLRFVISDGLPTGELEGELAQSWQSNADGTRWVFELAPGHLFDDGTPVNAQAVRFSFERAMAIGLGLSQALAGLRSVDVLDELRVSFEMAQPSPLLPFILALAPASVINPVAASHAIGGDFGRAWLSENTAGSGPYRAASWLRGQRLIFQPNPYAAIRPRQFDRVVMKIVRDEAAYRTQLRKGDIDIYDPVTPDSASAMRAAPDIDLVEGGMPALIALVPNNQRTPLDNPDVRRAIALGIDVPPIIRTVLRGMASEVHGLLPAGIPGHDEAIPPVTRDVQQARALLERAGHGQLSLTLSYVQYSAASDTIALALRSQLADIGVSLSLEVLPPNAMGKIVAGDFDLTIGSWYADFPDPWPILQFAYHSENIGGGLNLARYANPQVDRLLEAASVSMDMPARISSYREAQKLILADWAVINLFVLRGVIAARAAIEGLNYSFWLPGAYGAEGLVRQGGAA